MPTGVTEKYFFLLYWRLLKHLSLLLKIISETFVIYDTLNKVTRTLRLFADVLNFSNANL